VPLLIPSSLNTKQHLKPEVRLWAKSRAIDLAWVENGTVNDPCHALDGNSWWVPLLSN